MAEFDNHGQPPLGFHLTNNALKAINTLYGLCLGVIADGKVNQSEVLFLDTWLKDNHAYLDQFPLNIVARRLRNIQADGVICDAELDDLYHMLKSLVGESDELTGAAGGLSTALPFDDINYLDFDGRNFCFTGKFVFGSRTKCQLAIEKRGGKSTKTITKTLDYLVIGTLASRDWITSGHGRKIEKAMLYKQSGCNIIILSEQDWVRFI